MRAPARRAQVARGGPGASPRPGYRATSMGEIAGRGRGRGPCCTTTSPPRRRCSWPCWRSRAPRSWTTSAAASQARATRASGCARRWRRCSPSPRSTRTVAAAVRQHHARRPRGRRGRRAGTATRRCGRGAAGPAMPRRAGLDPESSGGGDGRDADRGAARRRRVGREPARHAARGARRGRRWTCSGRASCEGLGAGRGRGESRGTEGSCSGIAAEMRGQGRATMEWRRSGGWGPGEGRRPVDDMLRWHL